MWLMALFDLPVGTDIQRKHATQFRKLLLSNGFLRLQYSVYGRFFPSEEASVPVRTAVRQAVPEEGHVRLILLTDRQFGKMEVFHGENRLESETAPRQLLLF